MSKSCKACRKEFSVDAEQRDFLERIAPRFAGTRVPVPEPTLCPSCRLQRRLAYRNQIHVVQSKSSTTGKPLFSMFPGESPFPIISNADWWGEAGWNPEDYGRPFDFNRSFFEQFRELRDSVPRPAVNAMLSENSDYCNNTGELKNCYLVFDAGYCEDCLYLESAYLCRDCIDCTEVGRCELCYDCTACLRCYNLQSSANCSDCSESFFLQNCRSCRNCFGCANLVQSEYCIFNKQHSREEYQQFLAAIDLGSHATRTHWREKVHQHFASQPFPHLVGSRIENGTGNHIHSSKNVTESFFITDCEDVRFSFRVSQGAKDVQDLTIWGEGAELIYEACVCGASVFHLLFCFNCWNGAANLLYCDSCMGSTDCFGSVSLKRRQYAILNRVYSKAEYESLMPRILDHMRETGEWGEFFPIEHSLHPYNYTLAQLYFPLSEADCRERGYSYLSPPEANSVDARKAKDLPDGLPETDDAVVVASERSGRAYRITSGEIARFRRLRAPLPRLTWEERMAERSARLGPPALYPRRCERTGASLLSSYGPDWPYPIWSKEALDKSLV